MKEIRINGGVVASAASERRGRTRSWPASLGWVRRRAGNGRCGLAARVGDRIWWFAVRRSR